jgi:DNA modification methylase
MSRLAKISQADALDLPLESKSINLVVTSPPYFSFREYTDNGEHMGGIGDEQHPWQFIESLVSWMTEMWRVTTLDANVFVVIGDKYAGSGGHNNAGIGGTKKRGPAAYKKSTQMIGPRDTKFNVLNKSRMWLPQAFAYRCLQAGWILRQEIIWSKPNSIPTNAKDRGEFTHEYILHFVKQGKHYASPDLPRHTSVWDITPSEGIRVTKEDSERLGVDRHYAPFPTEIPRRVISGWCPPDGVVLDPFSGSGTTSLVASALGIQSHAFDLSASYVKLARWRCYVSDHRQRLLERWSDEGKN